MYSNQRHTDGEVDDTDDTDDTDDMYSFFILYKYQIRVEQGRSAAGRGFC
jgi:hypothetical protein